MHIKMTETNKKVYKKTKIQKVKLKMVKASKEMCQIKLIINNNKLKTQIC